MYNVEVCVPNKVSISELLNCNEKFEGREGVTSYNDKTIRLNLTGIWDLAVRDYDTFLDELVGVIIHEYLHYFFHVNEIPQNEELIGRLSDDLYILTLGHLIGPTDNREEDIEGYQKMD